VCRQTDILKITGRLFETFVINAPDTYHDDFPQYCSVIALLPPHKVIVFENFHVKHAF